MVQVRTSVYVDIFLNNPWKINVGKFNDHQEMCVEKIYRVFERGVLMEGLERQINDSLVEIKCG